MGGTVPPGCILIGGTVPPGSILIGGTVTAGCILNGGTVPSGCVLNEVNLPQGCILNLGTPMNSNKCCLVLKVVFCQMSSYVKDFILSNDGSF